MFTYPKINASLLVLPTEKGYIVYEPLSDTLHHLNPLASLVFELCDGTRSREEIHKIVEPFFYQVNNNEEVEEWFRLALEQNLIIDGEIKTNKVRKFSIKELVHLAYRLEKNGKVQTAFICQYRIAQLLPKNSKVWCKLGELAHILGKRKEARLAYEQYLSLKPDDAEVKHLLIALRDEVPPRRTPDDCIRQLYERFAPSYETNMLKELGYKAPQHLAYVVKMLVGERKGLSLLDLGCGTGLVGLELNKLDSIDWIVGVDLSLEMLELAKKREIYRRLEESEISCWLKSSSECFDLIVLCDTFCYFGELEDVLALAKQRLISGGIVIFTVERGEHSPYQLCDTGRYAHHKSYIKSLPAKLGMKEVFYDEMFLRMEYGYEVTGIFSGLLACY